LQAGQILAVEVYVGIASSEWPPISLKARATLKSGASHRKGGIMGFLKKIFGGGQTRPSIDHKTHVQTIFKEEVLNKSIDKVWELIEITMKEYSRLGRLDPWTMIISGFDSDKRELFEIPEVRSWCKAVHDKAGIVTLSLDTPSLCWYMWSLLDVEIIERNDKKFSVSVTQEKEKIEKMMKDLFFWNSAHLLQEGVGKEEIIRLARATNDRIATAIGVNFPREF
jgi:hypothetical protein